jgi:CoA:oxalate CoA-transferase
VTGPYEGLRVLDFSQWISGPFCTRMLADMGAEVVRVEARTGDGNRRLVPLEYAPGLTTAYAQYATGKRSICIDLKSAQGLEIALELAEWADVVVQNFSPGTMQRLGLGYEELNRRNPQIILCSIAAFGAEGPYSGLAGFGMVPEAYSGLMSMTGEKGGPPMHFGTPLADMNGGVHALASIGAALHRRTVTGEGSHIDLSLFDSLFSMIDQAVTLGTFTDGEMSLGRYGTTHPLTVPSGVFGTANGEYVTMAAVGDAQFAKLCGLMGRPELAGDARFVTMADRVQNSRALYTMVREWAGGIATADELVAQVHVAGFMAARVRSVEENLDDPHLIARGTLQPVDFPEVGTKLVPVAPYRISGTEVRPGGPAPSLGEHTVEVLRGVLGRDDDEIAALRKCTAVFTAQDLLDDVPDAAEQVSGAPR